MEAIVYVLVQAIPWGEQGQTCFCWVLKASSWPSALAVCKDLRWEMWRMTKNNMNKFHVVLHSSLRRLMKIYWYSKETNKETCNQTLIGARSSLATFSEWIPTGKRWQTERSGAEPQKRNTCFQVLIKLAVVACYHARKQGKTVAYCYYKVNLILNQYCCVYFFTGSPSSHCDFS